jgi:hypothetical protein
MKRPFLLIVVPALLIALGFAQTPAPAMNTNQTIQGCLSGSDGNYTVVEHSTGHIFKITTTSVDFKQHLGHEVAIVGSAARGESSDAPGNSFAVTELNMISDHCDAAAAAPLGTAGTPSETTGTPPAPAATSSTVAENTIAPAAEATPSAEIVATPAATIVPLAETVIAPVATVAPPAEIVVTPAATASIPSETVSQHAAGARRRPETPAAPTTAPDVTASSSAENASKPDSAAPLTTATSLPSEAASTPAAATTPAVTSKGWSMSFLIAFAVLVIVLGTMAPVISRWRKRKLAERTGAQNLSFTREASSDAKAENSGPRKAA